MTTQLQVIWLQFQIAIHTRNLINISIDPCVDFYQFACGNFNNLFPLTDDKPSRSSTESTQDRIELELKDLLEEKELPNDAKSAILAKRFFQSCINIHKLEELGLKPLKLLLQKYGGWPVVEGNAWNASKYSWIEMNARLRSSMRSGDFLEFSKISDYKNSSRRILDIDQASLGLDKREFYIDEDNKKLLNSYFDYMLATAIQLGANEEAAKLEMKQLLEFEIALAHANVRDEDRRDMNKIYHPTTVKELKNDYPKIDFATWFKISEQYGQPFYDNDTINLGGLPFLGKLPDLLKRFSARTLANYQIWMLIMEHIKLLAPSLKHNYLRYLNARKGITKFQPRWQECVKIILDELTIPVGAMYVKKYFSEESKREADQMVKNIRQAMRTSIDSNIWMDKYTKENANVKLDKMIQQIAFPSPDIYNDTWVMRDFKKAILNDDTYLDNYVSITLSKTDRIIREFRHPVNKTEWTGIIAVADAYYTPDTNTMTFPAGILRYPFYTAVAPNYFNYGGIGAVMGHELTHAFDDEGRQFDSDGNFELWWSNETLKHFETRAACFIDQFSKIRDTVTNQTLNGENTQGENIADDGGVRLAFDTWCTNVRPEALRTQIVSDVHAPGKYRVNVPMQNSPQFAQAFHCPNESPMNPSTKCQIW